MKARELVEALMEHLDWTVVARVPAADEDGPFWKLIDPAEVVEDQTEGIAPYFRVDLR